MQIKLKRDWNGFPAGAQVSVSEPQARQLIDAGKADAVEVGTRKAKRNKKATVSEVKGGA